MKLGPGLDLIEPVYFHGIVDIYDRGNQRIARKWPCRPKQPRTAKQVAHWEKFKASIRWRKALPGWWLELWKTINTPKGYSWDDMMRRTWWRKLSATRIMPYATGPNLHYYYCEDTWEGRLPKGLYVRVNSPVDHYPEFYWPHYKHAPNGYTIAFKWEIVGYKCFPGKKKTPQYELVFPDGWEMGITNYRLTGTQAGINWFLGPRYPTPLTMCGIFPHIGYSTQPQFVTSPQRYNNVWPLESQN